MLWHQFLRLVAHQSRKVEVFAYPTRLFLRRKLRYAKIGIVCSLQEDSVEPARAPADQDCAFQEFVAIAAKLAQTDSQLIVINPDLWILSRHCIQGQTAQ